MTQTETAFAACFEDVRRHDHDRFLTVLLAPAPARDALLALYAFNIEIARIPEAVSEPMMGQIRLQWWRETVEGLDRGETRGHAVAEALAATDISRDGLLALIDARERDLSEEPFADLPALESYADATSAAIMRLAAGALGVSVPESAVRNAGIAYALTGLLRALPLHASQGRLFMPANLLRFHDVDPHTVLTGRMTEGLRGVMCDVADRARTLLANARREPLPRAALPALLSVVLCERYLDLMTAPGFDPFHRSSDVPAFRRQLRLLRAKITGRV
ncbi:phytoene/squalene synthase family protein [Parvibaculum sp.]|uniref:phytoene/squalene synthase family protein n=1 Tax=Parvibaculum sp. TaxID=2024848 RepID=UPI001D412970|nr:phytoene/squalene synthase family protein [Parvibaculum sp.]MBX3487952.1 squalene/phytoene synthase family protein [Parvibaculum sp.]MCW5728054.1 squalene/phytoene synthase family protein [Parvibaculum sp.]